MVEASQALIPQLQADYRQELGVPQSPGFIQGGPLAPVKLVGRGVERANNRQRIKSYIVSKNAITTDYVQIATVTSTTRIFFLGYCGQIQSTGSFYLEDADTGNVGPSDGSVVGLGYWVGTTISGVFNPIPRECLRGIRARMVNAAATTQVAIIYYMEEDI